MRTQAKHNTNSTLRVRVHRTENSPLTKNETPNFMEYDDKSSRQSVPVINVCVNSESHRCTDSVPSLAPLHTTVNTVGTHSIPSNMNINVKPSSHYLQKSCYVQRYMHEIVPGIFCGSYHNAKDMGILIENGITHIVCCVGGVENPRRFPQNFKYLVIPAEDDAEYDIMQHFEEAFEFIDEALFGRVSMSNVSIGDSVTQKNMKGEMKVTLNDSAGVEGECQTSQDIVIPFTNKMTMAAEDGMISSLVVSSESVKPCYGEKEELDIVSRQHLGVSKCHVSPTSIAPYIPNNRILIHCGAGISRAPTIVCAYLIKKYQFTCAAPAIQLVQAARSCARPNPGFKKQLDKYASLTERKCNCL